SPDPSSDPTIPPHKMGSFRRPRPRFMSSPVLSDLPRFHATRQALQLSDSTAWNRDIIGQCAVSLVYYIIGQCAVSSVYYIIGQCVASPVHEGILSCLWECFVQTAVIKVFQGGGLQTSELYTLNESIRRLLKTELGSFISDYFQNQLLSKGLVHIAEKIQLYQGDSLLLILSETWDRFFTEILPTLQAIFYPVQGQELTIRQMALLGFRDLLPLDELLPCIQEQALPPITQMLLILQGIHDPSGPCEEYYQLERLVECVVSPYLGSCLDRRGTSCLLEGQMSKSHQKVVGLIHYGPEIVITQHAPDSLAPLVELEGEAYLEKLGGVRRHTIANAHSNLQLLAVASMMHSGMVEEDSLTKRHCQRAPHH
ncbi:PRR5L protein, partial [Polyodon spathula]|nr:PRR5L protein [Polyodon spathula]